MTAAIFGLIGVVIGGLITAAIEGFYRWRDGKHRLRKAARLLREELNWIGTAVDDIKEHGDPSKWDDPSQVLALWQAERDALVDLPYEEWREIEHAMRGLSHWDSHFTDPALTSTATPQEIVSTATEVRKQINSATDVLVKLVR